MLARSTRLFFRFILLAAIGIVPFSVSVGAPTLASCNADFTTCGIPEAVSLELPFAAIAGDAVLIDPGTTTVSDVFRIFNNLVDTGLGTGLGDTAFLYSADDGPLPPASTYSANVVFIEENPSGPVTSYIGNGTDYLLGVPEPRTFRLLMIAGLFVLPLLKRKTAFAREK